MRIQLIKDPIPAYTETNDLIAIEGSHDSGTITIYYPGGKKAEIDLPPEFRLPDGRKLFDVLQTDDNYVLFPTRVREHFNSRITFAVNAKRLATCSENTQHARSVKYPERRAFVLDFPDTSITVFVTIAEGKSAAELINNKQVALQRAKLATQKIEKNRLFTDLHGRENTTWQQDIAEGNGGSGSKGPKR